MSSNLPPSTEEAYRKKCIALRRRMQDVEENNDATRLRKARLVRGIRKMRIERAILLDSLAKRMRKNGAAGTVYDEDSEDSTESPPTPRERPLRVKKSHRRLQDMSSPPPIPSALPSATNQANFEKDPFVNISTADSSQKYARKDLVPAPATINRNEALSAVDLFREQFAKVKSKYNLELAGSVQEDDAARELFDSLPEDIRQEWVAVEQTMKSTVDRAKAAEEWKKTVGNRSRSMGNKPIDLDDDDVVMLGAEDVRH